MRVEVVTRLEVRADQEDDPRVGVVRAGTVDPHPIVVAGPPPAGADVGVRVVTVDAPGGEHAFGEAVLAGAAHVVHHLVVPTLGDGGADSLREVDERNVPAHPLPASGAARSHATQGVEAPVAIGHLVDRRRALGAVAASRAGVFGVALELAHLEGLAVDVGEQAARRLAIEAGGGHQHAVALDALRPGARVELLPVVPALPRREGGQVDATCSRVEGLAASLDGSPRRADPRLELAELAGPGHQARGTDWAACT